MSWTGKVSISLKAAEAIFQGVVFKQITVGDKVVGYRAQFKGIELEDPTLTKLCAQLWQLKEN